MSIKVDVTPLLKEVGRTSHLDLKEKMSWPGDGLDVVGPINAVIDLMNTGGDILLKAKVNAKVKLECARCLKKVDYPIQFELEEEYSKNPPAPIRSGPRGKSEKGKGELTNSDFIFTIEKDNTIDLTEAIRQNLLTELPLKPLCPGCPE